jgi:hypothetical protein
VLLRRAYCSGKVYRRMRATCSSMSLCLLLFSVLHSFWVANTVALKGDVACDRAAQFLTLAEKQGATVPRMIGHRLMGASLLCIGALAQGRTHLDQGIALYNATEHRPLATRFGQDNSQQLK